MFSVTSKSRKSITILSAAAAALLITGLGVSSAEATTLSWDPGHTHTAAGAKGTGNWDTTTANWLYGTSDVVWNSADAAGFTASGSGTYTVSVANGITAVGLNVTGGNNYTFQSVGTGPSTLTDTGILVFKTGTVILQNITIDNSAYFNNNTTGISEAYTGTLDIGSGGYLKGNEIAAGLGGSVPGVINVNSGGTLSESTRIQINYGAGQASGNELNVNGGTVNMSGGTLFLTDSNASNAANYAGVMNVGVGGTKGAVTVSEISSGGSAGQSGTLNIASGKVTTGFVDSATGVTTTLNVNGGTVTATNKPSITSANGGTTTVNLNGGILSVVDITEAAATSSKPAGNTIVNFNGGTLQENSQSTGLVANPSTAYATPSNLEVLNGGAVIDNNGFAVTIYNPLLQGTNADSTLSTGGLKVINSKTGGSLTLVGASTYTGATEISSGATLILSTRPAGQAPGAATIADTSSLQIHSGGTLTLNPDGVGTQLSVGGLNLQGGTINMGFYGRSMQGLLVGSTAAISGTNIINLSDLSGGTLGVPTGTYTLISDSFGGLTGSFQFANGSDTGTLVVGSNTYVATLNNSSTAETLVVGAVPEPASVALLAIGAMGLLLIRRRKTAA